MKKARLKKPVNVYKKERLATYLLIKAIPTLVRITNRHLAELGGEFKDTVLPARSESL